MTNAIMDARRKLRGRLRRAADVMPKGLAMFDADLRLVVANARCRQLLDLPERLVATGTALYDIVVFPARRGDLGPGHAEALAAERIAMLTNAPVDHATAGKTRTDAGIPLPRACPMAGW